MFIKNYTENKNTKEFGIRNATFSHKSEFYAKLDHSEGQITKKSWFYFISVFGTLFFVTVQSLHIFFDIFFHTVGHMNELNISLNSTQKTVCIKNAF